MDDKAERRERKLHKRRYGMRVSGRSVFLSQEIIGRKAKASQPHDHPQPGPLDSRGNCPGCVAYRKDQT